MQREDGDEGDVREHNPRHRHGLSELVGLADEARRSQTHEQGHVEIDEAEQSNLGQNEQREDVAREFVCFLPASLVQHARVGRQIGGVERALAEDLAELVGQLDRRDIGIIQRPAAHERGERHVAQKACQS
jgi:hypothetical protein